MYQVLNGEKIRIVSVLIIMNSEFQSEGFTYTVLVVLADSDFSLELGQRLVIVILRTWQMIGKVEYVLTAAKRKVFCFSSFSLHF